MLVNGKPTLACNTQIADVADDVLALAPLPNFDIIRDLVPDLQPMFDKHTALKPYLERADKDELGDPTDQYLQSPEELEQYLQFSYCIKCGCCMAACPTVATDPVYSGPQPLAQGYRFMIDSRDGDFAERKKLVAGAEGPWRCHYAGECSRVCPKGVDPARAVQLMKRELVLDFLRLSKLRRRKPTCVMPEDLKGERMPDIPDAPEYTVEGSK
jgi:succinate dehydrogenase / fumarate reductase iron-sulfur subunit